MAAPMTRLPGAIFSRRAEEALARGECVDCESIDIDAAPYTESPAARLRAVAKYTERVVEVTERTVA